MLIWTKELCMQCTLFIGFRFGFEVYFLKINTSAVARIRSNFISVEYFFHTLSLVLRTCSFDLLQNITNHKIMTLWNFSDFCEKNLTNTPLASTLSISGFRCLRVLSFPTPFQNWFSRTLFYGFLTQFNNNWKEILQRMRTLSYIKCSLLFIQTCY